MKNLLIIVMLLISGCAFIEKAPSEWDDHKNLSNASCVDVISGVYRNEGVYFDEKLKKSKAYLSRKFKLIKSDKENYEVIKINFTQNGDMIVGGLNNNLSTPLTFDKDSYECNGDRLRLSVSEGTNREGVFGFEKGFIDFKLINNYLYVKETSSAAAIVLLIPIVMHTQSYSKFERISER